MGFFRDEDTTGDEHNQSPELMIPQGKVKGAIDELINGISPAPPPARAKPMTR